MYRKRWFWFFAVLVGLGVVAAVVPVLYNLGMQLRAEQITEARQRWQQNGPVNYDLTLRSKSNNDAEDVFTVTVRDGKAVLVTCNHYPLSARPEVPQDFQAYAVPGLLKRIEDELNADLGSSRRRSYLAASFDSFNGYPLRYVRRDRETRQRTHWIVHLNSVAP